MTEPRQKHVAFLSLTQPQSPIAWRMFAARLARALVGGQRAQKLVREAALPLVRACAANCGPLRADASDDDHGSVFPAALRRGGRCACEDAWESLLGEV